MELFPPPVHPEGVQEEVRTTEPVSVKKPKETLGAQALPDHAMVEVFEKAEKAALHAVEEEVDGLFHK